MENRVLRRKPGSAENDAGEIRGADFSVFAGRYGGVEIIPNEERRRMHREIFLLRPSAFVEGFQIPGLGVRTVIFTQDAHMVAKKRHDRRTAGFFQFFRQPSEFAVGIVDSLDVILQSKFVVFGKRRRFDVDFMVRVLVALVGKMVFHRDGENEGRFIRLVPALQLGKDGVGQYRIGNEFPLDGGVGQIFEPYELFEPEERIRSGTVEKRLVVGMHGLGGVSGGTELGRNGRNGISEVLLVRNAAVRKPGDGGTGEHFEFHERGLASEHGRHEIPSPFFRPDGMEIGNRVF